MHTQANTLSGNETRLELRSLGAWRQGYLDRRNVNEGRVEENNGEQCVVEAMVMRHEFEGLDWVQGQGQPEDVRTRGEEQNSWGSTRCHQ